MAYQNINQLIINKLILFFVYEYVRICNSECSEMIQWGLEIGG